MATIRTAFIRRAVQMMALCAFLLALVGAGVWAAGSGPTDEYVPGRVLVQMKSGFTEADAAEVAAGIGATVLRKTTVQNWYLLESLSPDAVSVPDMQAKLALDHRVVASEPNYLYKRFGIIPNDRYWDLLWGMRMVNMPDAWTVERGSANIRVAVIDDGVDPDHADLVNRVIQGYDTSDQDINARPGPGDYHGTHVAGTIAAQGNNRVGVVGVCWDGVKIIPLKIFPSSTNEALAEALDIALKGRLIPFVQTAHVVNMSIGGPFSNMVEQKLAELNQAGILLVAATGNDAGPVSFPASSEHTIGVGAVGPLGVMTTYSNFGPEVDIAAPGGEARTGLSDDPDGIYSLFPFDLYSSIQGTSMACPHVAGAGALLMSKGMSASQAKAAMLRTAKRKGFPTPNDQYGYGILDVYAALQDTTASISFQNPQNGDVLSTRRPFFQVSLPDALPTTVDVVVDGVDAIANGVVVDGRISDFELDANSGEMVFSYLFNYTAGCPTGSEAPAREAHTVVVTAGSKRDVSNVSTQQLSFNIQPQVLQPGSLNMFSVPYATGTSDPSGIIGSPLYRMARAVTEVLPSGAPFLSYSFYNYPGLTNDPESSLNPPSVYVEEVYGALNTKPRGIGYWLDYRGATPQCLLADEAVDHRYAYEVDLKTGWNLIGNPYPFPISWSTVRFRYMGEWLSVDQAVAKGWISPAVFTYQNGAYQSFVSPNGVLQPWRSYWVRIRKPGSGVFLNSINDPRATMTIIFSPMRGFTPTQTGSGSFATTSASPKAEVAADMSAAGHGAAFSTESRKRRDPRRRLPTPAPGASASPAWQANLSVWQNGSRSGQASFGMNASAADGYDRWDMEMPPPATRNAGIGFVHNDWGADSGFFATDVRSAAGTKEWTLSVLTYEEGRIDLTWEGLPGAVDLEVTDLATGASVDLRSNSYQFAAPSGPAARYFLIKAEHKGR